MRNTFPLVIVLCLASNILAQPATQPAANATSRPAAYRSPEVASDGAVTFRLRAPAAQEVAVQCSMFAAANVPGVQNQLLKMTRGDGGLWAVTVKLPPELYEYRFMVDGLAVPDTANPGPMKAQNMSLVLVPADLPALYEFREVPHGMLHTVEYRSKSLGTQRRMQVYTPPGYDKDAATRYPVLYLLGGTGDNDTTWFTCGRVPYILDNLLAEGKVKPMIVVTPAAQIPGDGSPKPPNERYAQLEKELLEEVVPRTDATFRTQADAAHRALGGNSLGGAQTLLIGLNHVDTFATLVPMSPGLKPEDKFDQWFPTVRAGDVVGVSRQLKFMDVSLGTADPAAKESAALHEWLAAQGVPHQYHLVEGRHEWAFWRKDFPEVAGRLFKE